MSLRIQNETVSPRASGTAKQFLMMTCGATRLALPAEIVRGIVRPDQAGVADALSSLGVIEPVGDLAKRFGLSGLRSSPDSRIVVCATRGINRAFSVTEIIGLHDIDTRQIMSLLPHFTGPERRWFAGMFLFQKTVALVLEGGWLLSLDRETRGASQNPTILQGKDGLSVKQGAAGQTLRTSAQTHQGEKLDVMELEEATDEEDIPWAEL